MKKFIPLFIILLLLTGCGKSNTTQGIITDIMANLDVCESMSYDLNLNIDASSKTDETKIPLTMVYKLNVDTTKDLIHTKGTVITNNETTDVETYQSIENENNLFYFNEDGIWYRSEATNKMIFGTNFLKSIYSDTTFVINSEAEKINEKDCIEMSGTLQGESLKPLSEMFGLEFAEDSTIDVKTLVYKEIKYPAYIKIDLTKVANQLVDSGEVTTSYNDFTVELTFNTFNESVIEISDDIKAAKKKTTEEKDVVIQESDEKIPEVTETVEETSEVEEDPTVIVTDPEEVTPLDLSENWNAFQFQYEGNIYRVPLTYKSMEVTGYNLKEEEKTKIIEAGQEYSTTLYKGTNSIITKFINNTMAPKTLYECDIISIDLDVYSLSSDELAKFMFNNKITISSTYDEIIQKYGEPSNTHDGVALKILSYIENDNYIEIYFEPETLSIMEYKIFAK